MEKHNAQKKTPPWIARGEQILIFALVALGLAIGVGMRCWHYWRLGHEPIEIQAPPSNDSNFKIDINSAEWLLLSLVPGIGEGRARAIVKYRREHGRFNSIDDLTKVKGIGKKVLKRIHPFFTVEPEEAPVELQDAQEP
ncbi:MAG: helix-hairpin-helix domain-containing protein [Phycisphaerae bacterium]|jgi:competence ComEA-like helix-hairpin-helix protein|nr:helix-hairpin-helix domain-containing protein [Phycisphaerae bacterium]